MTKSRLTRLARLEAAHRVEPNSAVEWPPELTVAIGYLLDILTDEQSDDYLELLNAGSRDRDGEARLDGYLNLWFEIAGMDDLKPTGEATRPTVEVEQERRRRVEVMRHDLRLAGKFPFLK